MAQRRFFTEQNTDADNSSSTNTAFPSAQKIIDLLQKMQNADAEFLKLMKDDMEKQDDKTIQKKVKKVIPQNASKFKFNKQEQQNFITNLINQINSNDSTWIIDLYASCQILTLNNMGKISAQEALKALEDHGGYFGQLYLFTRTVHYVNKQKGALKTFLKLLFENIKNYKQLPNINNLLEDYAQKIRKESKDENEIKTKITEKLNYLYYKSIQSAHFRLSNENNDEIDATQKKEIFNTVTADKGKLIKHLCEVGKPQTTPNLSVTPLPNVTTVSATLYPATPSSIVDTSAITASNKTNNTNQLS